MPRLVLASASARRAELLRTAGLAFSVTPSLADETWQEGEAPLAYARRVTALKITNVKRTADRVLLAADTVVWIDPHRAPLGKPADRDAAARTLMELFEVGTHYVTTAWALWAPDAAEPTIRHETTRVTMRRLTDAELQAYLDTEDWRDKAGGYGIQESAAGWVTRVEGSYTSVVGLPLAQVIEALAPLGIHAHGDDDDVIG